MSGERTVVALTPAHNEARHLDALAESILAQDHRPAAWVIVDDGSHDDTGRIADAYAADHGFITVVHRDRRPERRLSSKAEAVAVAYRTALDAVPASAAPHFVAAVDADVEAPSHAFSYLVDRFDDNPRLGVAGGIYHHPVNGRMTRGRTGPVHVPGPLQMFRREVFDAIDGYRALRHGGLDVVSTAHARMLGWETRAFDELAITHSRRVGTGGDRHPVVAEWHNGIRDHSLAIGPLFELVKCGRRLLDHPPLIAAGARLGGYLGATLRRQPSELPPELVAFIRREHRRRLAGWIPRPRRGVAT